MPENLKPLSFLFFCYKPENYNAETWECLRRLTLMGGVALLAKPGDDGGQSALAGMMLGICFAIWERERVPWADPGTNALAISFSWVIFFSFMGAFVVITSEDGHHGIFSPKAVSWGLILMSFAVLVMAIYQQTKDFNLNRELLGLKNEVADFRRQAIGIVFARRTMRAFERLRCRFAHVRAVSVPPRAISARVVGAEGRLDDVVELGIVDEVDVAHLAVAEVAEHLEGHVDVRIRHEDPGTVE